MSQRKILLLHFVTDSLSYSYDDELEAALRKLDPAKNELLVLDNRSDGLSIYYAQEMLSDPNFVKIIICHFQENQEAGNVLSLFSVVARHQNVKLFTNQEPSWLKPFMIRLQGKRYENIEELLQLCSN